MIGIYAITHNKSGKQYIGQSVDIKARWQEHRRMLALGSHHNPKLQAHWNKYGPGAFKFHTLIECQKTELNALEQKYLDLEPWFNVAKCATAPTRGRKMPPGFGQKLSQILKGKKRTPEQRQRMSQNRIGIVFTPEHRAALRKANLGTTRPANRRQVKCMETEEIFPMLKAVVHKYGGRLSHLSTHLSGCETRKHFRGLHFVYVNVSKTWKPRGKRRIK